MDLYFEAQNPATKEAARDKLTKWAKHLGPKTQPIFSGNFFWNPAQLFQWGPA